MGKAPASKIKGRKFTTKHQVELAVLFVYIVQVKGWVSLEDILVYLREELGSSCAMSTAFKVAEQLRGRGLLVTNYMNGERAYGMGKVKFTRGTGVENAHTDIDGLISSLTEDPAGVAVVAEIRAELQTKTPKSQGDWPDKWGTYTVRMVLVDRMLGGMPLAGNPSIARSVMASQYHEHIDLNCDPKQIPLVFLRSHQGTLQIHTACIHGWFERHLPSLGISPASIKYFRFQPINISPEKDQVCIYINPIQRDETLTGGGQAAPGAGMGYYEGISPGTVITWKFDCPTENFPPLETLRFWLAQSLLSGIRTLSPARGRQTGHAELLDLTLTEWPDMTAWKKKGNGKAKVEEPAVEEVVEAVVEAVEEEMGPAEEV